MTTLVIVSPRDTVHSDIMILWMDGMLIAQTTIGDWVEAPDYHNGFAQLCRVGQPPETRCPLFDAASLPIKAAQTFDIPRAGYPIGLHQVTIIKDFFPAQTLCLAHGSISTRMFINTDTMHSPSTSFFPRSLAQATVR